MTIIIDGEVETTKHIKTGLHSLDLAFAGIQGETGLPLGILELYGPTFVGKSTLAYALLGLVAKKENKNFILADIEGFDQEHFIRCLETVGFDGHVQNLSGEKDEEIFDDLIVNLRREDVIGSLWDSIGAISPMQETKEVHGAAVMGRRAKLMAAHLRKNVHDRRNPNSKRLCIYTNHLLTNLGQPGSYTPGGSTIGYLSAMRVLVRRDENFPSAEVIKAGADCIAYTINGTIKKNRFGYRERKFSVFVVSGLGVHPGMTALWDCISYGLVKRGKTLSIDGKSVGYLKGFIENAINKDNSAFDVFYELLENHKPKQIEVVKKENEEDEENTEDGNDID